LFYSHDSYGLGHLRRSSLIAAAIAAQHPGNEVLIVTGSPRAQSFHQPNGVEVMSLPTATKDGSGRYQPRKLGTDIMRLVRLRAAIVDAAAEQFDPDVVLIDHAPLGMAGELRPLLTRLAKSAQRPRLVLGLREIIDDVTRVESAWHRNGVWDVLGLFDEILVYGDPAIKTTADELDLARRCRTPVSYTGYVAPQAAAVLEREEFVLVTAGGGGDGHTLIRKYLSAVESGAVSGVKSVVVSGPLLSARRRAVLAERADRLPEVELVEFCPNMRSMIASATCVISMAGYNTVVEELRAGVATLLVPRVAPRVEQLLRSRRLAAVSHLQYCAPRALTCDRIRAFVAGRRDHSSVEQRTIPVDLNGAATAAYRLSHPSQTTRQGSMASRPALSALDLASKNDWTHSNV